MLKESEKIVILNLMGIKELYLTLPLVQSVKKENSNSHVTMLLDSNLKEAVKNIEAVDNFFFFEKDEISNRLTNSAYNLVDNYKFIQKHLDKLLSEHYNVVINITNNKIGGIITSMLNTDTVKGLTFDEYGYKWIEDPWFNYFNNIASGSNYNLFHYIDIFSCGSGYFLPKDLNFKINNFKNIFIDFQKLTELKDKLEMYKVVNTIEDSDLVVTCDYATSLQASTKGKKVILVLDDDCYGFLEYGPYGEDNFVILNKEIDICFLFEFIKNKTIINKKHKVYVSRFDFDGFVEYVPYSDIKISSDDLYRWIYKSIWKNTLGRRIKAGDPRRFLAIGERYIDRVLDFDREIEYITNNVINCYRGNDTQNIINAIIEMEKSLPKIEKLKNLAFAGQKTAKDFLATVSIPGRELNEIKASKKRITEVDLEIFNLIDSACFLEPLINSFKIAREDLHVRNLFPLAKSIIVTFEDLFSRASFMHEIVKGLSERIRRKYGKK